MEEAGKYQQILDAAAELFAERGFEGASIQDIAQKAGVGKGTVYLYFKTKDDLIRQVYEYCYEMDIRACMEGVDEQKNTIDKLCRRMDNIIGYLLNHPREAKIEQMYKVFFGGRDSHSYYQEEMYQAINRVVREGIAKGELRDMPPSLLTRIYYGSADGLYFGFQEEPDLWEESRVKEQCHQLIRDSMAEQHT